MLGRFRGDLLASPSSATCPRSGSSVVLRAISIDARRCRRRRRDFQQPQPRPLRAPSAVQKDGDGEEKQKDDEPDLVTRIFGSIFGKSALEDRSPGGMKRLEGAALLEQYPATTDEFAEQVESDPADFAPIRRLLKNTRLEKTPIELAFDAEKHGWSCEAFLSKVATRGASVVVAETVGGAVIGGYAPRSWLGLGEEKSAMSAFLFTFPEGIGRAQQRSELVNGIKLPKVGGAGLALVDRPGTAIQFGAEGLTIPLDASGRQGGNPFGAKLAKCRLGTYYARLPAAEVSSGRGAPGGRSLFSPTEKDLAKTELVSLRVYVASGEAEKWDLDGVVWKTGGGDGGGGKE